MTQCEVGGSPIGHGVPKIQIGFPQNITDAKKQSVKTGGLPDIAEKGGKWGFEQVGVISKLMVRWKGGGSGWVSGGMG